MNNSTKFRQPNELRFIAKSVGLLALLTGIIYLRVVGVQSLSTLRSGSADRGTVLLFLLITVATLALLSGWRWEGIGGAVAILSAIGTGILAYLTVEDNKLFTAFAYCSPFLITGGLFLACWWRERTQVDKAG